MTDMVKEHVLIRPLRKLKRDGTTYSHPPEIERALETLSNLPIEEVARRATIADDKDEDYVPSECVLYFVRQSKLQGDTAPYFELFSVLRDRVLRAVPIFDRRIKGHKTPGNSMRQTDIQELVLQKFQELLCLDRAAYDDRLDYYETRFNSALASLRTDVQRHVTREESYLEPMQYDGDTLALSVEMEKALAHLKSTNSTNPEDSDYRFRLLAAIKTLPPPERRVVELILQDMPIDSKDKNVMTIAKTLGCVEKTVRNRRDRAFATIREKMQEDVA